MIQMPVRDEDSVNFWRLLVKLVQTIQPRQNSKLLQAPLTFRREKRWRIKLFLHGEGHAEIKENLSVTILKQNLVSADLVNSTVKG